MIERFVEKSGADKGQKILRSSLQEHYNKSMKPVPVRNNNKFYRYFMKNYSILEIAYWQCVPRQAAFTARFYSVLLFMGASLIISLAAYAGSTRKFRAIRRIPKVARSSNKCHEKAVAI
uniref:Uncharacterized protein n=1 Tax=Glossina pallidipes TaxID=7398 RepID=A0A1B0A0Q9_GLOPL